MFLGKFILLEIELFHLSYPILTLRYCPDCVSEDCEKYGETYWHRIHRLAGILTCPTHQSFLKNSSVQTGRTASAYFHDCETVLPAKILKTSNLNLQKSCHKILHKTACDAKFLLFNSSLQIGNEVVQYRYFNTLLKQGYAYYNGVLKYTKLLRDTQEFFPPEIFKMIGRVSDREKWIICLTQIGNVDITYHPIRHLLLITFLGLSVEEFLEDFLEYKPFGNLPYPCLNLASDHYREPRIQECKIFNNLSKDAAKQGIPLGIFRCECGFTYQRLGPDKTENDIFSYSLVKEYGEVWEDKLRDLWANLLLPSSKIAECVGISQPSVSRHAIRLGLPMNTENTRSLEGYKRHRNPNKSFSEMRQDYRKDWLKVRQDFPNLTRKQLGDRNNFFYLWLGRNDSEWLEENLPRRIQPD